MKSASLLLALAAALALGGCVNVNVDQPPVVTFKRLPAGLALDKTVTTGGTALLGHAEPAHDLADSPPSRRIYFRDTRRMSPLAVGPHARQNYVFVYDLTTVTPRSYPALYSAASRLSAILERRPSNKGYKGPRRRVAIPTDLPVYPPAPGARMAFQAHFAYISGRWGQGYITVTQFTRDGQNPANNEELCYLFQGLSNDKRYYVSAAFAISQPTLPASVEAARYAAITAGRHLGDYGPDVTHLDNLSGNTFTPKLNDIRTIIRNLNLLEKVRVMAKKRPARF